MRNDFLAYVKCYDKCQRFRGTLHSLPEKLHNLSSTWSFYKWGINILEPFLITSGQVKFIVIVVNYFTKWIEPKPLAMITAKKIRKFI